MIITNNELTMFLKTLDDNTPVYINCAYNRYEIKRIIDTGDYILLDAGEINNPSIELSFNEPDDFTPSAA